MTKKEALKFAVSKRGWHKNIQLNPEGTKNILSKNSLANYYKKRIEAGGEIDPTLASLILFNAGIILKCAESWELKKQF